VTDRACENSRPTAVRQAECGLNRLGSLVPPISVTVMTALTPPSAVKRVLLVVAMEQEVRPLVQRFGLEQIQPSPFLRGAPFVAWMGEVEGLILHVVWCGRDPRFGNVNNVATTAASVCLYAAVAAFGAPDLCISAGTAGGFASSGARVGDVYLSSKCVFHSRRIPDAAGHLEEYGFGHYRSPPLGKLASHIGVKTGVVSTSDSLDAVPMDLELMRSEGTSIKEMEAAAVAWVCQTLSVPFVALKSVTDIVDGPRATREEFEANLEAASLVLQVKTDALLRAVAGTLLAQWANDGSRTAPAAPAARRATDGTTTTATNNSAPPPAAEAPRAIPTVVDSCSSSVAMSIGPDGQSFEVLRV